LTIALTVCKTFEATRGRYMASAWMGTPLGSRTTLPSASRMVITPLVIPGSNVVSMTISGK
jgi:hypothetical protein